MNAMQWLSRVAALAVACGGAAVAWYPPAAVSASDLSSACSADCLEVLEENGFVHAFFLDAKGVRHTLSSTLKSEEGVTLSGETSVQVSPNVRRIPIDFVKDPAKGLGCGADGYGYDHGETVWRETISQTTGSGGKTRTDARSIYMSRGRGILFVTTTNIPSNGAPTSSTQTSSVEEAPRAGLPSRCIQAH